LSSSTSAQVGPHSDPRLGVCAPCFKQQNFHASPKRTMLEWICDFNQFEIALSTWQGGFLVVNGLLASAHSDWILDDFVERFLPSCTHLLPRIYQVYTWYDVPTYTSEHHGTAGCCCPLASALLSLRRLLLPRTPCADCLVQCHSVLQLDASAQQPSSSSTGRCTPSCDELH